MTQRKPTPKKVLPLVSDPEYHGTVAFGAEAAIQLAQQHADDSGCSSYGIFSYGVGRFAIRRVTTPRTRRHALEICHPRQEFVA